MYLQELQVRSFRNLKSLNLEFTPGVQALIGLNGAGKTNLLEAIYLLSGRRSFRTTHLQDLIEEGAEQAQLAAHFEKYGVSQHLKVHITPNKKSASYNHHPQKRWYGILPSILWLPEHLSLIRSGPSVRRRFLDDHLIQADPLYTHYWLRYQRSLKHRNAQLKAKKQEGIELFEHEMADAGSYLISIRRSLIEEMGPVFSETLNYFEMSGEHSLVYVGLDYPLKREEIREFLKEKWEKLRSVDGRLGFTTKGPHHDDLEILFRKKLARQFCSEGQARVSVAALKLAQWKDLKNKHESPFLLIDEVGMGLDPRRCELTFRMLEGWPQVFVTSPLPLKGLDAASVWYVEEGKISHTYLPVHG